MRVLVTGGAGFIGSSLARSLIARGDDVVVVDNLTTGKRSNVPEGTTFILGDVAQPAVAEDVVEPGLDAIVHLAAQSSGAIGQRDPYLDMQVNVGSTLMLSRFALAKGVKSFVYASSMTVYGHGNREPVSEDATCRPIGYYGASKLASESYLRLAADAGMTVTCLRLYNVYGAGQNLGNLYQGMASIYLAYLLDGVTVPVTGSLDRYRDFVHVDDAVAAMNAALEPSRRGFGVYNIGTGRKTTVRDLLAQLIAAMDLPADHPIDEQSGSSDDVFGSVADARLAAAELGWTPRVAFDAGLADMVAWAKRERRVPQPA